MPIARPDWPQATTVDAIAHYLAVVRHRIALKLPEGADPLAIERTMREKFRTERLGYDTVEERKRDFGRVLDNVNAFLSLVGFVDFHVVAPAAEFNSVVAKFLGFLANRFNG